MPFSDLQEAYKAGAKSARDSSIWVKVLPFVVVALVDVSKALYRHDMPDAVMSAIIWLVVAPVLYAWLLRKR